ncbi:DDB1- and CUL4-associated factor 12 [Cichlidogyrus casuarinus]|uniref:DDB1- and CUL4-associated factor 12 n=1 Tax=Cichlidogyrus casuarinus TaxID=1844966 RepID=A0ABD2Q493_9PLAT
MGTKESCAKKRQLDIGTRDKVFASQWLDNNHLIYGTKCNTLSVLDIDAGTSVNIPLIEDDEPDPPLASACGIHSIQINPSRTFLATGGANIHTIGVYELPELTPRCLFYGLHSDWIFDLRWIDDQHLISCSRDASIVLWSLPQDFAYSDPDSPPQDVTRVSRPVTQIFSRLSRDRLRALEYLPQISRLAVAAINRRFYVYDPVRMGQSGPSGNACISGLELNDRFRECVALRRWPDQPHCVALACHGNVLLFDIRTKLKDEASLARIITIPYIHSGVRSLNFNRDVISFGTSSGIVHFYNMTSGTSLPNQYKLEDGFLRAETEDRASSDLHIGLVGTNSRASLPPRLRQVPVPPSFNPPRRIMEPLEIESSDDASEVSDRDGHLAEAASLLSSLARRQSEDGTEEEPRHPRRRSLSPSVVFPRFSPARFHLQLERQFNLDFQQRLRNPFYLMRITGFLSERNQNPRNNLMQELADSYESPFRADFSSRPQVPAVYTHEYDLDKMRIFAAGGPIGSAFYGNAAAGSNWEGFIYPPPSFYPDQTPFAQNVLKALSELEQVGRTSKVAPQSTEEREKRLAYRRKRRSAGEVTSIQFYPTGACIRDLNGTNQ